MSERHPFQPSHSIHDVLTEIQDNEGTPPNQQRPILESKQLESGVTRCCHCCVLSHVHTSAVDGNDGLALE